VNENFKTIEDKLDELIELKKENLRIKIDILK